MPKTNVIDVAVKTSTRNNAPRSAKTAPSVSYREKFEVEKNAKNKAYFFILSEGLMDRFTAFCRDYSEQDVTDTQNAIQEATEPTETRIIAITRMQEKEFTDMMENLHGEEAVDDAYLVTECPQDTMQHDQMLRSTLRFYSNVRLLVSELRRVIPAAGCYE